ncbi:LLM class flavin-dependent oxidoreductase [Streptomyces sp. NPDC006193]|uniref:LLM class flavin-dependent oxidoreductase n=1 Tax=Streptomyces sp. NPDC006193 TaxID=3155717 RepID=UPI0033B6DB1B
MSGLLHLAAAVDRPGRFDDGSHLALARLAERGGLDFVTLDDPAGPLGPDALGALSRVAPGTRRIGLVPTVGTGHADALRAQAALAVLDRVSGGRAGWRTGVSAAEEEARLSGHRDAAPAGELPREAGGAAGWWQEATGRSPGPDRPHPAGRTGAAVPLRAPSALPPPPHGRPVRVVDAADGPARTVAARYADVALVHATTPARAAAVRDGLRQEARAAGRHPDALRVLVSLRVDLGGGEHTAGPGRGPARFGRSRELGEGGGGPRTAVQGPLYRGGPVDLAELVAAWHADGVADGFHFVPVEPHRDLERLVNGTVAVLQHRGRFRTFYPGGTLREHLGLTRPAHRHAPAGAPAVTGDGP